MRKIVFGIILGLIIAFYIGFKTSDFQIPYLQERTSVREEAQSGPSVIVNTQKAFVREMNDEELEGRVRLQDVLKVTQDDIIRKAFYDGSTAVPVKGIGFVTQILADDLKGSRHQKFILQLKNGMTLLIAHNIDLAPRVPQLKLGDEIAFYGEYAWNSKGGVIHWTHYDPGGRHFDGWLMRNNKRYYKK